MLVATDWWEVVGALGAAVGGLGATASATAEGRAARESRDASRDSLEALAVGIRTQLVVAYRQLPREAGA